MKKSSKQRIIVISVVSLLVAAASIFYISERGKDFSVSRQGVAFEHWIPAQADLVFSLKEREKISDSFFFPVLIQNLLEPGKISLRADALASLFQEREQIVFATLPSERKGGSFDFVFLFGAGDEEKLHRIIYQIAEKDNEKNEGATTPIFTSKLSTLRNIQIFQRSSDVVRYIGFIDDVGLMTNMSGKQIEALLSRFSNSETRLQGDLSFRTALKNLTQEELRSGYFFVRNGEIVERSPFFKNILGFFLGEERGTSAIGISHDQERLRFVLRNYQQKIARQTPYNITPLAARTSLITHPAAVFIGQNARTLIQTIPIIPHDERSIFFKDRAFAVAISGGEVLPPQFVFFVAGATTTEESKRFFESLGRSFTAWSQAMNVVLESTPEDPAVRIALSEEKYAGDMSLNLSPLAQRFPKIPLLKHFTNIVQFSFGLTSDNMFYFTNISDIRARLNAPDTVTTNTLFSQLSAEQPLNTVLLDARGIERLLASIEAIAVSEQALSADEQTAIVLLKKLLSAMNGIVLSTYSEKGGKRTELTINLENSVQGER